MIERLVLDAGALIALERNQRDMWARLKVAAEAGLDIVVPPGAMAQVWRGTPGQARLGQAVGSARPGAFDPIARAAGELCHAAGTADPIDASVVLEASGTSSAIATSDPDDISRLVQALPTDASTRITIIRA